MANPLTLTSTAVAITHSITVTRKVYTKIVSDISEKNTCSSETIIGTVYQTHSSPTHQQPGVDVLALSSEGKESVFTTIWTTRLFSSSSHGVLDIRTTVMGPCESIASPQSMTTYPSLPVLSKIPSNGAGIETVASSASSQNIMVLTATVMFIFAAISHL